MAFFLSPLLALGGRFLQGFVQSLGRCRVEFCLPCIECVCPVEILVFDRFAKTLEDALIAYSVDFRARVGEFLVHFVDELEKAGGGFRRILGNSDSDGCGPILPCQMLRLPDFTLFGRPLICRRITQKAGRAGIA